MVKAITIWQPYATLIMEGIKHYETRTWSTNYRGTLIIHAGKGLSQRETILIQSIQKQYPSLAFPIGVALGTVEIVSVSRTDAMIIDADQKIFGNFEVNNYAWELKNPVYFDTPVEIKGKQGLWDWAR